MIFEMFEMQSDFLALQIWINRDWENEKGGRELGTELKYSLSQIFYLIFQQFKDVTYTKKSNNSRIFVFISPQYIRLSLSFSTFFPLSLFN